ncbi:MAG TPA: adenosine deaminase family protein [Opitutaceae bacterium]|jgi:adenosine deaminase|nr:adenosine deaminase family protein [Opitutaceae bacterium]
MSGGVAEYVRALPKTETHLHIEGALPYELLMAWQPERYLAEPEFRGVRYCYPSFPHFEDILLAHAVPWFTSAQRYHDTARAIFASHVAQNVRYVETSFHLPAVQFAGVPGPEIVAAIRSAAPAGLEVRVFAGMKRNDYDGPLRPVIDSVTEWPGLAGIDLHGFEQVPTEPWTAQVWAKARAAGLVTKCHAGEFDGPSRVREAIEELGVTRVQHGVRSIEDPAVVELAARRGVTFDVCPISNVRLGVVPSIAEHPLRRLRAAGVRCTVSTDDPLCFGNTVIDEYVALAEEAGFTRAELASVARAGWEVADVPAAVRAANLAEIERLSRSAPG